MTKRIPEPSGRKLDRKLHQKLDGGLRRLLLMTDDEILKAVKTDQARLKKNLKELPVAGAKKRSPRAATGKGKNSPPGWISPGGCSCTLTQCSAL